MDMRPKSIKKHEWVFANMVPIFITKHKSIRDFPWSQNNYLFTGYTKTTEFYDGGILINCGIMKTETCFCESQALKT